MRPSETRDFGQGVFENVCGHAEKVPGYRSLASKDDRFWEEMEERLMADGIMDRRSVSDESR
jgi:hypothetical protein